MELINLSKHSKKWGNYHRRRDMETALAWNTIQKTLTRLEKWALIPYIKYVKITEQTVIISTEKPIINNELRSIEKYLITDINTALSLFHGYTGKRLHVL